MAPSLAAAMFIAAVVPGVWATRDLDWPYDLDHFRDIASAYTIQDSGGLHYPLQDPLQDPLYGGERAWYNPLIPALVALTASLLQAPVPETLARMGAWINTLPPLVFFLCARRLVDPLAAVPALCAYLFLPHNIPPWGAAAYTPWLFPAVTAHALFYGGVLLWLRALERPAAGRLLLAGLLLGLTMLAHTGSAVVLTGIIVVTASLAPARVSPVGARGLRGRLVAIALPGFVAAIVAAPFLLPLAWRYGLRVVNRAPGAWIDERLLFGNLPALLKPTALPTLALVSIGTVRLARQGFARQGLAQRGLAQQGLARQGLAPRDFAREGVARGGVTLPTMILAAWAVTAIAGFIYSTIGQSSSTLPTIVPAYHFYFLLRALSCLAFGAGFVAIAQALAHWWSRPRLSSSNQAPANSGSADAASARGTSRVVSHVTVTLVVTLALAASLYPGYLKRPAFTTAPDAARAVAAQLDDREASVWIRAHTAPQAVVLAYDDDGLRIVGAAGRKTLCVDPFFSNPYVDRQPRHEARDRLFAAIVANDRDAFRAIAAPFGITHVLFRPALFRTVDLARVPWLHADYARPEVVVARVTF